MKLFLFILALGLATHTQAGLPLHHTEHWDLELTSQELERRAGPQLQFIVARPLDQTLAVGRRNLEFLNHLNRSRRTPLAFTKPGDLKGFPIDEPLEYNETLIVADFNKNKAGLPVPLREILVDGKVFPNQLPIAEAEYIEWGRKLDVIYSRALRWQMMEPRRSSLAQRRKYDVTGFYFLERDPQRDTNLDRFEQLSPPVQTKYLSHLTSVCLNNGKNLTTCDADLNSARRQGLLKTFYKNHRSQAEATWNSFHDIPSGVRFSEYNWKTRKQAIEFDFEEPSSREIRNFLKTNIEAGWNLNLWKLAVSFVSPNGRAVEVQWVPGVVPHVPGLGSRTIVMDSDSPLTEWDVQWTIRHEFGHVIGFPDCYLEYYDTQRAVIVAYQLDITDMMCSRAGSLKPRHTQEIQRVYQ